MKKLLLLLLLVPLLAYGQTIDTAKVAVWYEAKYNNGVEDVALTTSREVLEPMGKRLKGVRIDSGDIAYLSKKCREILDEAGLTDCTIVASNSLDEFIITDLLDQGAKLDSFGVGERLITAKSAPVFGCVYKLAAVEREGKIIPKIDRKSVV